MSRSHEELDTDERINRQKAVGEQREGERGALRS